MTDQEMDFPIDDELRQLADDYLGQAELPPAQVDAAFAKLSTAAAPAATGLSAGTKLGLALVGAIGLGALAFGLRPTPPAPAPVAQTQEVVAPSVTPAEPEPEAVVEEAPPPVEEAPLIDDEGEDPEPTEPLVSKPKATPKPKAAKAPKAKPSPASNTKAELLLLERARQALRSGNGASCLQLLDEHARKYPTSRFRSERDATKVSAYCKLGKVEKAKSAAKRYVTRHGQGSFDPADPCKR